MITVLLFLSISIAYFYFLVDPVNINVWEIRYYLFFMLMGIVLSIFGILRIYNAVVGNTRFLMSLQREFNKIRSGITDFGKSVDKHRNDVTKTHAIFKPLHKKLDDLKASIQDLTDKIKR